MLSTGDEVLYGQIIDTNAAWLAQFFFEEGFLLTRRFTVGDNLDQLVKTLKERSEKNDILIINGGLGPTSDDMSAQAAAIASQVPLALNHDWLIEMENYFTSRGLLMSPANRKQAILPSSAIIVPNPIGTACGFRMQLNHCTLFFTPGVPSEFKLMIKNEILPYIKNHYPAIHKPLCYRLTTMGRSESDLATEIENTLSIPDGISVGYRSSMPIIELKITGSEPLKNDMDKLWEQLKNLVKQNTLYEGAITKQGEIGLAKLVSSQLSDNNFTIAVLEEQTSGMIGHQLFEAKAPIIKWEVIPKKLENPKNHLQNLLIDSGATLAIGLVNFKEKNREFTFILTTQTEFLELNLEYTSRKQNRETELQIYTAIALDAVRRYLLNLPLIGPNIWLSVK